MDSGFTKEVKSLICDIFLITRKHPQYVQVSTRRWEVVNQFDPQHLDQLLIEGKIDERKHQQILKYKEQSMNRLEKQEALLDSARMDMQHSSYQNSTFNKNTDSKGQENNSSSVEIVDRSENVSEFDSKDLRQLKEAAENP